VRVGTAATSLPKSWLYLAVRPKDTVLYCTYLANQVAATVQEALRLQALSAAQILGTTALLQPWYYVLGSCNLKGTSAIPRASRLSS